MDIKCAGCGVVNSDKNHSCWSCGKPLQAATAERKNMFEGIPMGETRSEQPWSDALPVGIGILRGIAWTELLGVAICLVICVPMSFDSHVNIKISVVLPYCFGAIFSSLLIFAVAGIWDSAERTRRTLDRIEKQLLRRN